MHNVLNREAFLCLDAFVLAGATETTLDGLTNWSSSFGLYGLEEVQLETLTKDPTHAELTAIFPMRRPGPEEAVIQCRIRGGAQAQLWTLSSLVLARLQ